MNSDIIVTSGWLESLIECARRDSDIGVVGCVTNLVWNDYGEFPNLKGLSNIREIHKTAALVRLKNCNKTEETIFVHGMCMCIKREVINKVGLFDERFYPCSGEDIDYCIRVRESGYKLFIAMDSFVFHFYSRTLKTQFDNHKLICRTAWKRVIEKWGDKGRKFYKRLNIMSREKFKEIKKNLSCIR